MSTRYAARPTTAFDRHRADDLDHPIRLAGLRRDDHRRRRHLRGLSPAGIVHGDGVPIGHFPGGVVALRAEARRLAQRRNRAGMGLPGARRSRRPSPRLSGPRISTWAMAMGPSWLTPGMPATYHPWPSQRATQFLPLCEILGHVVGPVEGPLRVVADGRGQSVVADLLAVDVQLRSSPWQAT